MKNLFDILVEANKKAKDKYAILTEKNKYTFAEYLSKAKKVANFLIKEDFDLKKPFLVLIDDNEYDLFAFMGILGAGGYYVAINYKTPKERLEEIIKRYDFAGILSSKESSIFSKDIKEIIETNEEIDMKFLNKSIRTSPAFGMFTSGSTGSPKLVLKSHGSIIDQCRNFNEEFNFTREDIFGNQVSFEFDSSCKSIFLSIYNLAAIALIPPKYFMFPKKILDLINYFQASVLIWSTFALRIMENFKAFSYKKIPSVKKVMFSGEILPKRTAIYWMENSQAKFYNLYAPTEVSFNCLYHEISKDDDLLNIPAGKEVPGSKIYILDEENKPCKENEEGQIFVGGEGLALGYYDDFEKTNMTFVQNPLQNKYREIFYKTGDFGLIKNGEIYFKGRMDNQVKHLGYRIELGEIENRINALEGIDISGVLFEKEKELISVFYQGQIDEKNMFRLLKDKLPRHMMPKKIIRLDVMPLNRNNKVDRNKLKEYLGEKND
ncbi:amino acid adenylation domain-containing protein [Peptoniphilus koenoeneniae]|uniref:Amino acid adenylation domain-containing protein n=1 Tax=Peptoniphilus koenoeneniae TaxID=507751 RepID=A0ABU0AUU1_9FIRM|nr:AMP-binding protein [Peptoniphilus koenoeneniae]MDQ0275026.1 amino acid adenylation domain-containing protein [Peptoniphilus koenoeneniae]